MESLNNPTACRIVWVLAWTIALLKQQFSVRQLPCEKVGISTFVLLSKQRRTNKYCLLALSFGLFLSPFPTIQWKWTAAEAVPPG